MDLHLVASVHAKMSRMDTKGIYPSSGSRRSHSTAIEKFNDLKIVLHALWSVQYYGQIINFNDFKFFILLLWLRYDMF